MKQPARKIKKKQVIDEHFGIDFCNECPFLTITDTSAHCNASDVMLNFKDINNIPVPKNCGNNKTTWKESIK